MNAWKKRAWQLRGDWKFTILNGPRVNVFVTEFCPRHIFVHDAFMASFNPSDDELALVLSHEISHLLLGHGENTTDFITIVSFLQLFLTAFVDPSGVTSFLFDVLGVRASQYLMAAHSRANETEADDLGIQISSFGCFDVKKGIGIFRKFLKESERMSGQPGQKKHADWLDSHPSNHDRVLFLEERYSKVISVNKEVRDKCSTLGGILWSVLALPR